MTEQKLLNIGILAGESSGDILGADLIRQMQNQSGYTLKFYGIGGPLMHKQGLNQLYPIDRLAVNGFFEPLKRLPELLRLKRNLIEHFSQISIDLFIGIDFNGFNLVLEKALRDNGIPVVHYVSPTVWAWRKGRMRKIEQSVDLMLTLYPFETDYYANSRVDAEFVGHPLADKIPKNANKKQARQALSLDLEAIYLAVLPGSRISEVKLLLDLFMETAICCSKKITDLKLIIPAANESCYEYIKTEVAQQYSFLSVEIVKSNTQTVLTASDVVLVKSGTATLETLLCKRPMVMAYRLGWLTYKIVSSMVSINQFALPNILAGKSIVPEFIQEKATPEVLSEAILAELNSTPEHKSELMLTFDHIHDQLRCNQGQKAANAVLNLLSRR